MNQPSTTKSLFSLSGKLTKIYSKKERVKYIKLATAQGKYLIKISKKLSRKIADLSCGCQIEVAGELKQSKKKSKRKYKAQAIAVIPQDLDKKAAIETKVVSLPSENAQAKSKARVLICQKSNCWKKGGKQVYEELDSILGDRNLDNEVTIKKTGCLKKCKKAPNVVMLPDKAQYTKVKPKQVENLVEKHLISR